MTTTAGAQVVLETSPGATGATRVRAWVQGPELQLADARTGEPVEAPDVDERATSSGGRLLWVVESDSVDELGMRHVILRQRLRPASGSVTLPGGLMRDGVPLHGSLVGLHYDPEGNLKVVGASMFEDAATVGGLALLTPDHAYEMAAWGLSQRDDLAVDALELLSPEAAAAIRRDARLELFSLGDGRSFDFVWTVPVVDSEGRAHSARVHGATGELLQSWEGAFPWSGSEAPGLIPGFEKQPKTIVGPSCYPTPIPTAVTATARRQRDLGSGQEHPRSIHLAVSPSPVLSAWYGQGVTHQAMAAAGGSTPEIRVYSGWPSNSGETQCTLIDRTRDLRLVPLTTDGGSPVFEDLRNVDGDVDIAGRAAGDALSHARTALGVLGGLGWAGFSGGLDIVVNSWHDVNGASFKPAPAGGYDDPKTSTNRDAIHFHHRSADATEERYREPLFKDSTRLMFSAAQDIVAHEIGHGVMYNLGTGWVRDPFNGGMTWGDVMQEGWADVVGLIVEWATQSPTAVNSETPDWLAGEDTFVTSGADAWDRRWDDYDDGDDVGFSLHARDDAGLPSDPDDEPWAYYTSNRLPLAYRLSVTGGRNPVCSRNGVTDYWTGCEKHSSQPTFCTEHPWFCPSGSLFEVVGVPDPVSGVGDMGQAFFRALRIYHMHMDDWDWDSVADFVQVAAHDLFRSVYVPGTWPPQVCDDAFAHQIAVVGAFRSIGYEGSGGWVCMCQSPCSPPVEW